MRPKGTPEALEQRRRLAMRLLKQGLTLQEVADQVGSSISSVHRWKEKVKVGGIKALKAQPHPHRPALLSLKQKQQLQELLLQGPQAHGYPDQLWTLKRIAELIQKYFGVTYHISHVWRILSYQLGWSCQKPERHAREKDPKAIEEWRKKTWPHIKKL